MVQTVINKKQAFGVEGSIYDQSPVRASAYIAGTGGVTIGKVCTKATSTPDVASLGGSDVFAGIAINHLEYANVSGLSASMAVPAGAQVTCCTFGHVVVRSKVAASVGYVGIYNTTTGEISAETDTSQSLDSGWAFIPNSKYIVGGGAGELCVLELSN